MKKLAFTGFQLLLTLLVFSQEKTLKERALDEFVHEHYPEAIALLEQAVKITPDDADLYYYLGWFNHYRAYDSRPLSGYDYAYSEKIFAYLDKALKLKPDYGDAKYFYGAECSGNAFISMQNYDCGRLRHFYKLAFQKGAYPDWLIEFGKNLLNSCEQNTILFTGGNADFDICAYLQLCENFRTDVTVIPLGNIDRPWYVQFLKKGLEGGVRSVKINLTEQQIMDIHPFKWEMTDIQIDISATDKRNLNLPDTFHMTWTVVPDLVSERMQTKIDTEAPKKRKFLSPQRAVLLQIVQDNFSERPIYFTNFAAPDLYGGLEEYFNNYGLVSKLMPFKTKDSGYAINAAQMENLLTADNLKYYKNIRENNFPRISGLLISGYSNVFLYLADFYRNQQNNAKISGLAALYQLQMCVGIDQDFEQGNLKDINK